MYVIYKKGACAFTACSQSQFAISMDPFENFIVPTDDSDEIDVVMRAFGINGERNRRRPFLGGAALDEEQGDTSIVNQVSDVSITYQSPKQRRFNGGGTKKGYFRNGKWYKISHGRSKPEPKECQMYYIGYRTKAVSDLFGFSDQGKLFHLPTKEGWAYRESNVYSYSSQAVRSFLLSIMAPDLRTKFDASMGEVGQLLHKTNYEKHSSELALYEPFHHFVLCYEPTTNACNIYQVVINFCQPTTFYPFEHYKMPNPTVFMPLPKVDSPKKAHYWILANVTRYAVPAQ